MEQRANFKVLLPVNMKSNRTKLEELGYESLNTSIEYTSTFLCVYPEIKKFKFLISYENFRNEECKEMLSSKYNKWLLKEEKELQLKNNKMNLENHEFKAGDTFLYVKGNTVRLLSLLNPVVKKGKTYFDVLDYINVEDKLSPKNSYEEQRTLNDLTLDNLLDILDETVYLGALGEDVSGEITAKAKSLIDIEMAKNDAEILRKLFNKESENSGRERLSEEEFDKILDEAKNNTLKLIFKKKLASELKPFSKVIIKAEGDEEDEMTKWLPVFFSYLEGNKVYFTGFTSAPYYDEEFDILPYNEKTKYLVGTDLDYDYSNAPI